MRYLRTASFLFIFWAILAASPAVRGQQEPLLARAKTALDDATKTQRDIVTRLEQILKEQRMALSDGALIAMLQTLIADEHKVIEGTQLLGQQTLGKTKSDLTDSESARSAALTQDQESCADRYTSFQRGAEHKALERPSSPFARVVLQAAEADLGERMAATPRMIEENQLALALQEITEIVAILEKMASFLKGEIGEDDAGGAGGVAETITLPQLIGKGGGYIAPTFAWSGDIIDTLGVILRAVRLLEEQAKKQQEIATEVKKLADQGVATPQPRLATSEWEIRATVREIAQELGIVDQVMETQVYLAVGNIEIAIPSLESGAIPQAVEPTQLAADQLAAAAESLKKTWDDILNRLAEYTAQAEGIPAGNATGVPHGVSDEMVEKIRQLVFALLRATGGMGMVLKQQEAVHHSTLAAAVPDSATMTPRALATKQRGVLDLLATEVIPFNVLTPPYDSRHAPLKKRDYISHLLIEDASALLRQASKEIEAEDFDKASANQKKATKFLDEALAEMVLALQQLLGQYSPPAMSIRDGTSMGIAIRGNPAGNIRSGWAWKLPTRRQTEVLQAFRGSFPDRYATLIQLYFKNIAAEGMED